MIVSVEIPKIFTIGRPRLRGRKGSASRTYSPPHALSTLWLGSGWKVVLNGVTGRSCSKCWRRCQRSSPTNVTAFDFPPENGPWKPTRFNREIRAPRLIGLNLLPTGDAQATSRTARSMLSMTGIGYCRERLKSNQSSKAAWRPSRDSSSVAA